MIFFNKSQSCFCVIIEDALNGNSFFLPIYVKDDVAIIVYLEFSLSMICV